MRTPRHNHFQTADIPAKPASRDKNAARQGQGRPIIPIHTDSAWLEAALWRENEGAAINLACLQWNPFF